jgi:dienelactone hydrolase
LRPAAGSGSDVGMRFALPSCLIVRSCLATALLGLGFSASLLAQAGLVEEVETYLRVPGEEAAQQQLESLLAQKPDVLEVLGAVQAVRIEKGTDGKEKTLFNQDGSITVPFPFGGEQLEYRVWLPEGFRRDGPRYPVVLDIAGGHHFDVLGMKRCVRVGVLRFDSQEFTDRRRDAYLKGLRSAAHRFHGDPGRMWMLGYSWSAHASWDIAQHRPGVLRGIAGFGGGPRRVYFRLMPNLQGTVLRAFCGAKDDPELVWNLREMERVAKLEKLDYKFVLDPEQGHNMPLQGYETLEGTVMTTPALEWPETGKRSGVLLADGNRVESPLLRFDAVMANRVAVPKRIPVSARLSPDGQRRATIAKMAKAVASLRWSWSREDDKTRITIKPRYVRAYSVLLREPYVQVGDRIELRGGSKILYRDKLEPDLRTLLEEARRTGERLRPALRRVSVGR